MKASINAFKGYNFQGTIYLYFACLMDLYREIIEIDSEKNIDGDFDDIYIKTINESYYIQVKNYLNITFENIKIENNVIKISNHKDINIDNEEDNNMVIFKDLDIPKSEINLFIFDMQCHDNQNCIIASYNEQDITELISKMYSDDARLNKIITFVDSKINSGIYNLKIEELPKLYLFNQKLCEETKIIRSNLLDKNINTLFILGKPGVGKSHLVNELEENGEIDNILIERLWISENDVDKDERLKYSKFIGDISKRIFRKTFIESEENIIAKLKESHITLVVDGLDHVENYNNKDLEKYFDFFKKCNGLIKLLVLTRPLKKKIDYPTLILKNWNEQETLDYLEFINVGDYEIQLKIYAISEGYPIIVSFLGEHYLLNNQLPLLNKVESLFNFYDSLIKERITGLSIFLVNNSYYKKDELKILLSPMECKMVEDTIDLNPYLFSLKNDRIYLIHDSLNLYLREKFPNYITLNDTSLDKIMNDLIKGEVRFLSRLNSIRLKDIDKIKIAKKYCDFDALNTIYNKTYDYEMIIDVYANLEEIISKNFKQFSINEIYTFLLINECVKRDHHNGFDELIIERLKYYKSNDIISIEDIYSSGLLYSIYTYFQYDDHSLIEDYYSSKGYLKEESVCNFKLQNDESEGYFDIYDTEFDLEGYLNNISSISEYDNKEKLIYFISYLYIKKINYKNYEKIAIAIIDEKDDSKAEKLFKELCKKYNIREFMAKWAVDEIKDYLFSLGVDSDENYYKSLSLKQLILNFSEKGSFHVNQYITKYIRLANREKRKIDIESVYLYYSMYYQRKDYTAYCLPKSLLIFYRKKYISLQECIEIIDNTMDMSEKGIRLLKTNFYNLLSNDEFNYAFYLNSENVIISDLYVDKINCLPERIVADYFCKNILSYYYSNKDVPSNVITNLLLSRYSKNIIKAFKYYDFCIDSMPIAKFDFSNLEDRNQIKSFDERDYVIKDDSINIKINNISCIDLAKRTDGWYNALPYVELFDIYDKNILRENVYEILYNACFGFKKYGYYANRFYLLGNYLSFIEKYIINDVVWDKFYSDFDQFITVSLMKK